MLKRILIAAGLLLAACSPPAAEQAETVQAAPVTATGVITEIDAPGRSVTINHEPIPAVGWSAMTMGFFAEESADLSGLAVGDYVSFTLKSADAPNVIVAIAKQ